MSQPEQNNGHSSGEVAVPASPKRAVDISAPLSDLDATFRFSQALAMSGLIPEALRGKPNDVLVTILYGQEMGLRPMQAMQVIDVVKGKPFMRATLWAAKVRQAGHKLHVPEDTAQAVTVRITRFDDPEPYIERFTIEEAKQAGYTSNALYSKDPRTMLWSRAVTRCSKKACPEVALGFGDEYEAEIMRSDTPPPNLAQVAAQREDRPVSPARVPQQFSDADIQDAVLAAEAEYVGGAQPQQWTDVVVTEPGGGQQ